MNNKRATYQAILKHGRDAAFLANIVICHHSNPAKKLRGLLALLDAGRTVQTASFSLDVLLIDGEKADWQTLESR